MTRTEFKAAVKLATSGVNLSAVDTSTMDGCGLPGFVPVAVTLRQVAALLLWQAQQFNGEWDAVELDNCARIARVRFLLVG